LYPQTAAQHAVEPAAGRWSQAALGDPQSGQRLAELEPDEVRLGVGTARLPKGLPAPTQRKPIGGRLYGVDVTEPIGMMAVRDEDLVERAADGDIDAFEALVAARLNRAFRTASAILGSEADAHDVVQEAFVATWRHLPKLRDRSRFDAWLNRTIVNRCRDALRQRRRSREVALDEALDHRTEDSTRVAADMAAFTTAFERLSVDHRHLLVMHHLHRVPVADLARELGIPEGTTKWRLHAARAALTRALEADR
jgi:RNA polymerase sigma-70 factor (ECF subfamily)